MSTDKPDLAILTLTPGGMVQACCLANLIACDCYTSDKLVTEGFLGFEGGMRHCVKRLFGEYKALLFICATGICVRMIAPLVSDKLTDPAVLVMDEQGKYVISLLSGHVGKANDLTLEIAQLMGASAVITTATDVNQVSALDTLISRIGAPVAEYRQEVKLVNQMLVSRQKVGLYLDNVLVRDTRGFSELSDLSTLPNDLSALVVVSARTDIEVQCSVPVVWVIPRNIVIGIGCRRGCDGELLYQNLCKHLEFLKIDTRAILKIGSIELKQNEPGLVELKNRLNVPFIVFSAQALKEHETRFSQSGFVQQTVGVGSVSQPAAWIMSDGHLLEPTFKQDGMTITLGVNQCCI